MEKKLIIANWKNHPESLAQAQEILEFTDDYLGSLAEKKEFSLVFCPPFLFLEEAARILKTSHLEHMAFLGAQDISPDDKTTLTGEISAPMLSDIGVRYVIIGHSERRWKLNESDKEVNKKLKTALKNDFLPVVCIGEKTRDDDFMKFLKKQIEATFEGLTADEMARCIVAYEPVWAISTSPGALPDNPASALESIAVIKNVLAGRYPLATNRYLYGGSVNSKNIEGFIKEPEISGVLVGGASVKKEEFVKILEIASHI